MTKPTIKQIAEAIYLLSKKTDPADLVRSIAGYAVAEHQTKNIDRILREVERLQLERDGRLEITAISARELSPAVKAEIATLFDAPNKNIVQRIDQSLVGGVTVQALDSWLDLSVRGKLTRLKNVDYQTSLKG